MLRKSIIFNSYSLNKIYRLNSVIKRYLMLRMNLTPNKIFLWKKSKKDKEMNNFANKNQQISSEK